MKALDNLFNRVGDVTAERDRLKRALECLLEDHKRMFPKCHPNSAIEWKECVEVVMAHEALAGEDS